MPQCRVYERADGTVAGVVHPAPKSRFLGEAEAYWYARLMARTEAASLAAAETAEAAARAAPDDRVAQEHAVAMRALVLVGLSFHDCEAADLPPRERRNQWRIRDGKVVVADV